jgi:hypothetical protein
MSTSVRHAVFRLLAAVVALIGLMFACYYADKNFRGIVGGVIILLAFPAALILGINASRAISRELPDRKSVRIFGVVFGIPQAVLGAILAGFGCVYPFIGIRAFWSDLSAGQSGNVPFVTTIISIMMLGIGCYYLQQGLGLGRNKPKKAKKKHKPKT